MEITGAREKDGDTEARVSDTGVVKGSRCKTREGGNRENAGIYNGNG